MMQMTDSSAGSGSAVNPVFLQIQRCTLEHQDDVLALIEEFDQEERGVGKSKPDMTEV